MQTDCASKCGGKRLKGILAQSRADCPLVTVITAVFNGRSYLEGCLESVLRQDYPNIEYIVVDGGSSDGTVDVLRQYDDQLAFWKSEADQGVYDAWNKALGLARGEWIAFLGADDEYLPGAISSYMAVAGENPSADYISSKVKFLYPSGYSRTIGRPWEWPLFNRYMCSLHVGSMHRRRLFERYGHFDTSYRISADYEFLLRSRGELRSAFVPAVTVHMRAGGVSDSVAALYEANRAKLETGGLQKSVALFDLCLAIFKCWARTLVLYIVSGFKKTIAFVLCTQRRS